MIGESYLSQMRMAGSRPPGFVVVTEARDVAANARQRGLYPLIFDPEKPEDWRVIHGLDVALLTDLPREQVVDLCKAIIEAGPLSFSTRFFHSDEYEVVIPYGTKHAAR